MPTVFKIFEEKVVTFFPFKILLVRSVEDFLYKLKFTLWLFLEDNLINAPILQFHLQHLKVSLLLLVQLAVIADIVDH